jgi:thiol-disulfide isomerase/thioredoxin
VAVSTANNSNSTRYFGWAGNRIKSETNNFITDTGQISYLQKRLTKTAPSKGLNPNEIPYVDESGDTFSNYAIVVGAPFCLYCKKMYPIIKQLREEGYTVYYINIEEWPDIKERLNKVKGDPKVSDIGLGIPWTIIRENNKTIKLFRGYIAIDKIRPWLKKNNKGKKKPVAPEPYNFKAIRHESTAGFKKP